MVPGVADALLAGREVSGGEQVEAGTPVRDPARGAQGAVGRVEVVHLAAVLLAPVEHGAVLAVQDGLGGQLREAGGHGAVHPVEVVPLPVDALLAVEHAAVVAVAHGLGGELGEAGGHGARLLVEVVPGVADALLALIRLSICGNIENAVFSLFPKVELTICLCRQQGSRSINGTSSIGSRDFLPCGIISTDDSLLRLQRICIYSHGLQQREGVQCARKGNRS